MTTETQVLDLTRYKDGDVVRIFSPECTRGYFQIQVLKETTNFFGVAIETTGFCVLSPRMIYSKERGGRVDEARPAHYFGFPE